MSKLAKSLAAAAGNAGAADAPNVEKVFSTYLYEGTGSHQSIVNGIDLAGEGGMVWIKNREATYDHFVSDSERSDGLTYPLRPNDSAAGYQMDTNGISAFNSDGFDVEISGYFNSSYYKSFASWTFRKAPRFFDVVTYTGNGVAGREIAHDLGCEVGMLIVKRTDSSASWQVFHRTTTGTKALWLDQNYVPTTDIAYWDNTNPTDSVFTVGDNSTVNSNNGSYVAYLFAHDPNGEDDDGVIACGSYTGNAGVQSINLGWEPQYVLIKQSTGTGGWAIYDSMRTMVVSDDAVGHPLYAHLSNSEDTTFSIKPQATGFAPPNAGSGLLNGNGDTYIYMAIRAPMMVEPEAGTEVFKANYGLNASADGKAFEAGFPVDMYFRNNLAGSSYYLSDRMRGGNKYLTTQYTGAESTLAFSDKLDNQTGVYTTSASNYSAWMCWMFKRAKGFFDVVAYTGNATLGRTVNHSLGVVPEMMWVKSRTVTGYWSVFNKDIGATDPDGAAGVRMVLNGTNVPAGSDSFWADTLPTATVFSVGDGEPNNGDMVAYLFATLAGVSKVGSYTGTGATLNIDCGFSNGARFVLIKRTDSNEVTGDWYIWDTARGIVGGNDPHLSLNTTAVNVTSDDSIDPQSAGFTVNQVAATNINVTSATYIFLAIA